MRRATAMPSTKTDYYDEVSPWNVTSEILYSCIYLLCFFFRVKQFRDVFTSR